MPPALLSARIVPVVGIAPAMLLTRGKVNAPPSRGGVSVAHGFNDEPVRTDAVESVSAGGLRSAVGQVAQELASRLDQALGSQRRGGFSPSR